MGSLLILERGPFPLRYEGKKMWGLELRANMSLNWELLSVENLWWRRVESGCTQRERGCDNISADNKMPLKPGMVMSVINSFCLSHLGYSCLCVLQQTHPGSQDMKCPKALGQWRDSHLTPLFHLFHFFLRIVLTITHLGKVWHSHLGMGSSG